MAYGASSTGESRCSHDVIRCLSHATSWLHFLLCWLRSQWSLHMRWPLMALGIYPTSLAAPVDWEHPFLESSSRSQWTRLGHVFILNKANQEHGISHWPNLGHVLVLLSLIGARLWVGKGFSLTTKLLPHKGGQDAGQPTATKVQDLVSPSSMHPLTTTHVTLHVITVSLTYLCPCFPRGKTTSSFISPPRTDTAQCQVHKQPLWYQPLD